MAEVVKNFDGAAKRDDDARKIGVDKRETARDMVDKVGCWVKGVRGLLIELILVERIGGLNSVGVGIKVSLWIIYSIIIKVFIQEHLPITS